MPYHGDVERPQDTRPSFREKQFVDCFLKIPFVFDVFFLTDFPLKSGVFGDVESNHVGGYTISMPYEGDVERPQDTRPSFREKQFLVIFC